MPEAQGTELGRGFWAITADMTGLKQGLEKGRAGVESAGGAFHKHGQKISTSMMAAGGAIIGAMGMAVRSAAAAGDELMNLKGITGMSTDALQDFRFAGEQAGVELSTINRSLERFSPNLQKMIKDAEDGTGTLHDLNIPVRELQAMHPDQQFLTMAEAISQLGTRAERESVSMELFGTRAGRRMRPMLDEGAEGIARYAQQMDELGLRMDKDGIEKSAELREQMDLLNRQIRAVWVEIGTQLMPVMLDMAEPLSDMIASTAKWVKENDGLAKGLLATGVALFTLGKAMKFVLITAKTFALVKAAISAAAIPFIGWKIAVGLLIAAGVTGIAGLLMGRGTEMPEAPPSMPEMMGDAGMGGPAAGAVPQAQGIPGGGQGLGSTVNIDARGAYIRDEADMDKMARDIGDYTAAQLAGAGA